MKADELVTLIRKRYPVNRPNGYQSHVVLEQVPDGTGMYQGHWIDVVVFSLWPHKGLTRSAFEIKVSRSDFFHELQNPMKHKWALESFHEFWFVAPQDVIQISELPFNTGWMCPRGSKLVIKRHATRNQTPKLDDVLLAGFMRAASKEIDRVNRITSKEVLEGSKEYKRAKIFEDAVVSFISQRGGSKYMEPECYEDVIRWLDDATMDKQLLQDREHLLTAANRFQRDIVGLLSLFLTLANKSLLARDALGGYIVSSFGGDDDGSVEALKKYAQSKNAREYQKRFAELVELVLNWQRLANRDSV